MLMTDNIKDTNKKENILFEVKDIVKKYPGVEALKGVSMKIYENDIIGFAGENGAGKSTLLKIISGVEKPTSGQMLFKGKSYNPVNFREANIIGVSMVFQEQNLVPQLSVYENLFLSHEEKFQKVGFLSKRNMIERAAQYMKNFDLDVDPKKEIIKYSFHERQMLEIIRAFVVADMYNIKTPLILLDEPTAGLPEKERALLLEKIKSFSGSATFIFVSHRLSELMTACNRIVVLKDGMRVGEVDPKTCVEKDIHPLMVGRELSGDTYRVREQLPIDENKKVVLQVKNLTSKSEYKSVNFELRKGEILGIGGLLGSGKKEIGEILFGIGNFQEGSIEINGNPLHKTNMRTIKKMKVGYVPAERKEHGIVNFMEVSKNLSLPSLRELSGKLNFINGKEENELVNNGIEKFRIKARASDECYSLSGGNQQKIVLAKWMTKDLDILILDNPTRGIDVGAKEEIYGFLREAAKNNLAIVLITDDLLELIGLSNKIIVMKDGNIESVFDANKDKKPTERELVQHMV